MGNLISFKICIDKGISYVLPTNKFGILAKFVLDSKRERESIAQIVFPLVAVFSGMTFIARIY